MMDLVNRMMDGDNGGSSCGGDCGEVKAGLESEAWMQYGAISRGLARGLLKHVNTTATAASAKDDAEAQFLFMVADGLMLFFASWMMHITKKCLEGGRLMWCCSSERKRTLAIQGLELGVWSCLWFAFSVSLVLYNKWLLHSWEGGFDFPLTISMFHMFLKYVLSLVFVRCTSMRDQLPNIPRRVWWLSAVPVGVATALDVAASNASYLYITVTFYTIVKSTSLIFTLFFSILYKLQPLSLNLILAVILVGMGVVLSSYDDTEFNIIGFGLILGASAVGGFRWALTQVLMKQIKSHLDAILTIYLISPASALTLVPMTIWLEGYRFVTSKFVQPPLVFLSVLNIVGSGFFAFAMILVELQLLRITSSMTLGIISYAKQILQVSFAVLIFSDQLTASKVIGFLITLLGMFFYTYIKQTPEKSHIQHANVDNDGLFVFDEFGEDGLYPDLQDFHESTESLNGGGSNNNSSGSSRRRTGSDSGVTSRLNSTRSYSSTSSADSESTYQSVDLS